MVQIHSGQDANGEDRLEKVIEIAARMHKVADVDNQRKDYKYP
jgi:hypothetical protein